MDFIYDNAGSPYAMIYNGDVYYYVLNLQGDVIRLIDEQGTTAATYSYYAWGELSNTPNALGRLNPIRYRGYYYDNETGFYYLQSRYYDPSIGRFINADSFVSTGQSFIGHNMFAYCLNNPVNRHDSSGYISPLATKVITKAITTGIVSAICAFATGSSLVEIVESFVVGLGQGALSAFSSTGKMIAVAWSTIGAAYSCWENGSSMENIVLAGVTTFFASTIGIPDKYLNSNTLNIVVDLTFGLGASLLSAGVTEYGKRSGSNKANQSAQSHSGSQNPVNKSKVPSQHSSAGSRPSYSGFGMQSTGMYRGNNYTIPNLNHHGWIA